MVLSATLKLFVVLVAAAGMTGPGGGLVGADLAGCKAKCTGSYKSSCDYGCTNMLGSSTTKSACDSYCVRSVLLVTVYAV